MLSTRPVAVPGPLGIYPAKTPARSKSRAENIRPGVPKTVQVDLNTQHAPRPLGDKTPFPNRARNVNVVQDSLRKGELEQKLPKLLKLLYPSLGNQEETPELYKRPSSTRRSARTLHGVHKKFQTPLINGNPWDVSEESIELGEVQKQGQIKEDVEVDLDEIEYMPPNTLDLPYQPPFEFDLPNYKEVGKTLFDLVHSYPVDDTPLPEHQPDMSDLKADWDLLPSLDGLDKLLDDPFYRAKPPPPESTVCKPSSSLAPREKLTRATSGDVIKRSAAGRTISGSSTSATTSSTTARGRIFRPATATTVARPVTQSVSKAATVELPKRPASATVVSSSLARPRVTASQPRAVSEIARAKGTMALKGSSDRASGTAVSTTIASGVLIETKEEQPDLGRIVLKPELEIAGDFLFEV